jgi:YceI-like domain
MRKGLATVAIVAGLIAGCAAPPPRPTGPADQVPADFPAQRYLAAISRGGVVFRIDPAQSVAVIEVRRAGSLARLGHDHVIASHDLRGYAAPNEGRADLYVPLDRLVVDEPELRAEAGFDTVPSESDIAGTRRNMLTRVLDVDRYPFALVAVSGVVPGTSDPVASVALTLNGTTRTMRVPLQIRSGSGDIAVSGHVALKQTDFGIVPLSILGGAIQVEDEVKLHFEIRAHQ